MDGELRYQTPEIMIEEADVIAATDRPLSEVHPDWYATGTPTLDGAEVVVPAQHTIEVVDMTAELRAQRQHDVDRRTDALIAQGFTFDGQQFSLSLAAQSTWMGLKVATDAGMMPAEQYPIEITTLDDHAYRLAYADRDAFFAKVLASVQGHLAQGRALKQQLFAAPRCRRPRGGGG